MATVSTYRLPRQGLIAMTEARVFDLYNDQMPSLNDLEGYAGETVSGLIQLACLVLNRGEEPGTATAAGHAGVAYALAGLMRALPWHASRRQMYLPRDVCARHNLDPESVFRGRQHRNSRLFLPNCAVTCAITSDGSGRRPPKCRQPVTPPSCRWCWSSRS